MSERIPTTRELVEIKTFKKTESPDLSLDDVSAAMEKARSMRNAERRANFKLKDEQSTEEDVARAAAARFGFTPAPKEEETVEAVETTDPVEATTEVETTAESPSKEEIQDAVDAGELDGEQKITKLVNGRAVTRTLQQWLDAASKVDDADAYLHQAREHLTRTTRASEPVAVETTTEADDIELVRALQQGTEVEAAAALNKIRDQAARKAQAAQAQAALKEQSQLAVRRVLDANKDLAKDPILADAAYAQDAKMFNAGKIFDQDPIRNLELRFTEAWKLVRAWNAGRTAEAKNDVKRGELIRRKQQIANVTKATARVPVNADPKAPTFKTEAEYAEYVAEQMQRSSTARGRLRKISVVR